MKNIGLISIIIPVYKTQSYLEDCIISILKQSYANYEVIIVLDGPDDDCFSMCDKYKNIDNRINVYVIPHQGVSAARNYGMRMMHGEYVAFVDSDDILHPEYLSVLLDDINRHNSDIACCNYSVLNGKEGYVTSDACVVSGQEAISYCRMKKANRPYYGTALWNKLFRVSSLQNTDVFDESFSYGEDAVFMFNIMSRVKLVSFNKSPLYYYRATTPNTKKEYDTISNYVKYYEWEKLFFISIDYDEELIAESERLLHQYQIHSMVGEYNCGNENSRKELLDNWGLVKKYIINDTKTEYLGRIKMRIVLSMIRFNFNRRVVAFVYNLHN